MAHLGESPSITTVQDKEIVLTSTTGELFKMNLSDLSEAIRQVMPVATNQKNGLVRATDSRLLNKKGIYFVNKESCIKLYSCEGTATVNFILSHNCIEGETAKVILVSFSMAINSTFVIKAICLLKGTTIMPELRYAKVGNKADIYLVTKNGWTNTSIFPISENNNYIYHMTESVLPAGSVNVIIE